MLTYSSFLRNLSETFQADWQNFAFFKKLITLIQKIQFLNGSDALHLTHSFTHEVSDNILLAKVKRW